MTLAALPTGLFDGGLPPLRLSDTRHPRHDRRDVNRRWLVATSVLAVIAASLLGGILQSTLHRVSKLRAPEVATRVPQGPVASAEGRADRLRLRTAAPAVSPSPLATRLLRSTGLGTKPLTVLVADLGHMSALERIAPAGEPDVPQEVASHDQSPAPPSLPAIIRTGAAAAPTIAGLTAFAEPGPLGQALNVTTRAGEPPTPPDRRSVIVAQRGDTIERALASFGLAPAAMREIADALGTGRCTGGETIVVTETADPGASGSRPERVLFARPDGATMTAALADDGHYARAAPRVGSGDGALASAATQAAEVDDASIKQSLDALNGHAGVGRALVANVVRVLGTDRDLGDAVTAADRIEVLYAADPGDEETDQELDYAALTADGRVTRLYRFAAADDNSVDYYDETGHSLSKFLLRKPVANGRLGDGFGWRIHPVLGDRRFHEGVDYAAPFGSPIVAAGAGIVDKIDYESGYGKYIRIRHDLGYETTYAHVAGYPRGMAVGRRVQQGETIAFIGSTGLSTGPHLYYEVKINDHNVDPLRIRIAAGRILDGQALAAFEARRNRIDTLMKASRGAS